jgi:hypothetical protein
MVQLCLRCQRANPPDAAYCFFDGVVLAGRPGGSIRGSVPSDAFPSPFVLPSGRSCRSFAELAAGCETDWEAALEALEHGFFEAFLSGLGRADLAVRAREAARLPDADQGLNQLLSWLPAADTRPASLSVRPETVDLGILRIGDSCQFDLRLENRGAGLVFGAVTCTDDLWLAPGGLAGGGKKHFQFRRQTTIAIRVCGDRLRAGAKPLEAHLLVESNGGSFTVAVRASVPAVPYPDGPFVGCTTPRQVAERAKADPKNVAFLFETGAVARWYQSNGWVYPVQGPAASGLGAVQQFFEALGLTNPPRIELASPTVELEGQPGQRLNARFEVHSPERRPVYAYGASSVPWLIPRRAELNGRKATIPLEVPAVPDRPGESLSGQLTVHANGHQRFVVPVTLRVTANPFDFGAPDRERIPETAAPSPASAIEVRPIPDSPTRTIPRRPSAPGQRGKWNRLHALPAGTLLVALAGLLLFDARSKPAASAKVPADKRMGVFYGEVADREPRLLFNRNPEHDLRFGLVMTRERDPNDPEKPKRLTYEEFGSSNNTCVKIDGAEHLLGQRPGHLAGERFDPDRLAWMATWAYDDSGVQIIQVVQIVPGAQTGLLDTCLVRYSVENVGTVPRDVGLRVLFDTFIGAEDGVPFLVAGRKGLLTKPTAFTEKQIPSHMEALERPDPASPGTVAYMGLKNLQLPDGTPEPIVRMVIGTWPGSAKKWEWEEEASTRGKDIKDSAVTLYWDYRKTLPGEAREMAFSYGLNAISAAEGEGTLAVSTGGTYQVGAEFTATAYVKKPRPGQLLRLDFPQADVALADGESAEQVINDGGQFAQVSWRLRAVREGTHTLRVTSGRARASFQVKITSRGLFR